MKLQFDSDFSLKERETAVRFFTTAMRERIPVPLTRGEWSASRNSTVLLHRENLLCVGLGDAAKVDARAFRVAAGTAASRLKEAGRSHAMLDLSDWPKLAGPAVEGALLSDYRFEKFKREADREEPIRSLRCVATASDLAAVRRDGARAIVLAEATNFARDLCNQPGNHLYPAALADWAETLAAREKLRLDVFDEKALRRKKCGGILAVGSGSARLPRLIVLEHRGGPASQRPIALVGKAITFDSGGISIKPAANMEAMIFDKAGGMAVLGAMAGIARLKIKHNVVGIIPAAENMPDAAAYRPGDIITTYDGQNIEIVNTDAEGRVVMADAIAYARIDKRARVIIDLATLTGACGVALGKHAAGLWSNSREIEEAVLAASERAGERLWPMPLFSEYIEQIKSDVAHWKNSGGRLGGACTGAAFLQAFAEETPWAHLDIAHVADLENSRSDLARGATGFGVRTLIEFVDRLTARRGSWRIGP